MYIADLHLHSRFSRACSKELNIPNLSKWAKIKGINLLGTGDFLHPVWREELKKDLRDLGTGIYEYDGTKFVLSCEISSIYKDKGKVRRIHLVILLPNIASVEKLSAELTKRKVNLKSDGRPITGISAKDLTAITLAVEPKAIIIPAHVFTPYFGLYGSMSGYDFLEECFEDLSKEIFAVETGLSADPKMCWRMANLDNKTIISSSDAHSLAKLGREATIFNGGISYDELLDDLKKQSLIGTIEFFPEEGKYHYSGHRDCGIIFSPKEIKKQGEICPVCHKRLTIGVTTRVEDLASRSVEDLDLQTKEGVVKTNVYPERPAFKMLVGLDKIIAESFKVGLTTKKVQAEYDKLTNFLGSEIQILTQTPLLKISEYAGSKIAEGVERVREGKLTIEPGFDNTYGKIKIWLD